jgi:hypothetical protein
MGKLDNNCILCDCIIDNIWLCNTCFNKVGDKNFGNAIFSLPEYLDDSQHSKWLKLKLLE